MDRVTLELERESVVATLWVAVSASFESQTETAAVTGCLSVPVKAWLLVLAWTALTGAKHRAAETVLVVVVFELVAGP
jgi:hypothetical protein